MITTTLNLYEIATKQISQIKHYYVAANSYEEAPIIFDKCRVLLGAATDIQETITSIEMISQVGAEDTLLTDRETTAATGSGI